MSCQNCSNLSPFGRAIDVGLSKVIIMSLTLLLSSLSNEWPPVRSSADAMSYSTDGSGSRINRAADATLGSTCHCRASISHKLLSNALLCRGSRSSIRNGSLAPAALASEVIPLSLSCGLSMSRFNPGCRSKRLPMNRRMISMSSGGATSVNLANLFAKAATKASGKCLCEKNCLFFTFYFSSLK